MKQIVDEEVDEEAVRLLEQKLAGVINDENGETWERPILFDEYDVPEIPASLLPEPFGSFAAALAESTETDEGQSVMGVLGILSCIAGGRFEVKINHGHKEPCHIYNITGIESGNIKSGIFKACTEPLNVWERQRKRILEPERKAIISKMKTMEEVIKEKRKQAAKMKDNEQELEKAILEISSLEAALPSLPALPKLWQSDSTNEATARFLSEQGGRGALFSDEGGLLEVAGGLYSKGNANIDILLKGFDGGLVRIRRSDREIDISPHLTLCLFVQPVVLQSMAGKGAFRGKGLLERPFYYLPKSRLGYRTHEAKPIPEAITTAYQNWVLELLDIAPDYDENGIAQPHVLTLAPSVKRAWINFKQGLEPEFRPGGKLHHFAGWGSKAINSVLRLAGIFHVAKHGTSNLVIDADSASRAFEMVELFIPHALAAVQIMGLTQDMADAKELFSWMVSQKQEVFTRRDITYAMRSRAMGRSERLDDAFDILEDRHIVRAKKMPTATKSYTLYRLNPQVLTEEK